MSDIKISIVIPVYNTEKYIAECLDSILKQTFTEYEVICVDDGSKDNSVKILQDYANKSDKIKVISIEHSGTSVARNTGMVNAKGKYIIFVDADDFIIDTLLEETYNKAEKDELDLVCFNVANFDDKTKVVVENQFFPPDFWPYNCEKEVLSWKNYRNIFAGNFSAANKLYRLDFLKENNVTFPENLNFEDHPFHLKSFIKAKKLGVINRSLYFYRKNTGVSFMSKMIRDNRCLDIFKVLDMLKEIIVEQDIYDFVRVNYYEYFIGLVCEMYMTSISWFMRPKFFKKMKKACETFEKDNDIQFTVLQSRVAMYYADILVCNCIIFYLKYKLLELGQKTMRRLKTMSES